MGPLYHAAPTRYELMAEFGLGEDAQVVREVVETNSRGPRHQPRLSAGARVRILAALPGDAEEGPMYRVEVCDPHGRASGYWALVSGDNLAQASPLGLIDWLRSQRRR